MGGGGVRVHTVDFNITSSDEPRCVTAQQHNRAVELVPTTHTSQRRSSQPYLPVLVQAVALVQDRVHVARRDRVDRDPVPPPLGREVLAHHQHAGFRDVVVDLRLWEVCRMSGYGGYQDDRATGILRYHFPARGGKGVEGKG